MASEKREESGRRRNACPRERRVLFLSYPFPPVGGAGVQRTAKFVKYLRRFGWSTSVITVANPSVPVWDHSLLAEVPDDVAVLRAKTWEPPYAAKAAAMGGGSRAGGLSGVKRALHRAAKFVLQPDPQILWLPDAFEKGRRLLKQMSHHAVVASGPPFSTFILGVALSRSAGIPLILDYRDEWDINNAHLENKRLDPVSLRIQARMQHAVVRHADALVATTRASARSLQTICDRIGARTRVEFIYNGYDAADFDSEVPARSAEDAATYRLVYVGTLWNLTSIAPVVEAARVVATRWPSLATRLELVFAGRATPAQDQILNSLCGLPCRVTRRGYVDHRTAVDITRDADGILILLSDVPAAGRVVPAKLFESMAARRTIWAVCPRGEVWDLLHQHPAAALIEPSDVSGFADRLATAIKDKSISRSPLLEDFDPGRYERGNLTGQLARLLDELVDA
jgi:glycosyltransferase involved in cell wall biosynthesis